MKKLIACVALAGLSLLAWALPTLQQVEAQVGQGNYAQAESMMREVVAAKPGSARAHYVYAEILAHERKYAQAVEEARAARTIDPDVKFTDPEKFRTFEAALLRAQNAGSLSSTTPSRVQAPAPVQPTPARVAPAPASAGVPGWVWLAGLGAIGFVLWRMLSRSRAASLAGGGVAVPRPGDAMPMQAGTTAPPYGGVPGAPGAPYGPGYPAQRPGSGMLGVGLGAAGGLAAGMLAERMLSSRHEGNPDHPSTSTGFFDSPQGGGADDDLANRPIDFGTGGNDWDAGSSDVGGSDGGGGDGWD
ncbi:MAG TPA: tetratricopeptide repeat protein [Caldimonas sp.]|nr:tetratricopeptide repeat protein [Caldimonas sp.]